MPTTTYTRDRKIMFEKMQGIYFYSQQRVILSLRRLMACTDIPGDVMWSLVVNKNVYSISFKDYMLHKPCGHI